MFGAKWSELTFELFKREPNSIKIFELVRAEIDKALQDRDFDELFEDSENSAGSYCGMSFKKDQLLYHCSDCALDETCVLCEKCFNYEAHKDHNYWYTIGTNNSGSCDCGEEDSWKNDLKCPHHIPANNNSNGSSDGTDSNKLKDLREIVFPVLDFVIESLIRYLNSRNETKTEDSIVVLYNDENHSFDDVIDILCTEIEISTEDAEAYANLVDSKGFAPILVSSSATCLRMSRKFRSLVASVESIKTVFEMLLVTEMFSILAEKVESSTLLRKLFVEWLLLSKNDSNNLGILFKLDHTLWKSFRLAFNEILNSCNAIDQESKKLIAFTYCKHYKKIFELFLKEKRESHLSVTNFSVQIFTLIPVAEYCLENTNVLADLFNKMIEILEPGFTPSSGLDFAKLRLFNFQKFSVLTHDALHLTRNVRSKDLNVPNLIGIVDTFMYLLSLLTHMQGHFHKTGDHVVYERDNYDNANYICFEVQQVAQELAKIIVNNCELSSIWSLFEKHIDQKSTLSRLSMITKNDEDREYRLSPPYKSRGSCSFFGSLAWFYSACVREALGSCPQLTVPSKVVKCFAIDSLRRLLFSSEVRSNLWVRNGLIVRQQEYFYSSTVYHNLTYFADVYNCIIGSHLMDRIPFIEMMAKCSCVIEYLQDPDQTGPVIDQFMIILINCCSLKIPEVNCDQILINSLCTESMTKSSLIKILPEFLSDEAGFRQKLLEMSHLTAVNSIGIDAKLEVKRAYLKRFDPFYWAFSMNLRLKAWSNFKEQASSLDDLDVNSKSSYLDRFYDLFIATYLLPPEITKEADFLIEMLLNFADSTSTDYDFALEMLLILLKGVTSQTSDQDCLMRISNCIEKFKLKKSIPERILSFLASICPSNPESPIHAMDIDDQGETRVKRKSSILASFKRQRDVFITDTNDVLEDDENYCVVCSESGNGEEDGNYIGVPIQENESSLMTKPSEFQTKSCFLKGCYHLVHRKCFDRLPSAGPGCSFKKCSLCNSAIDSVIPLITDSKNIKLNITDNFDKNATLEKLELVNNSESDFLDAEDSFFGTLCYLGKSTESIESLPLHQILTLTQYKRNFVFEFSNKVKFDTTSMMKLLQSDVADINEIDVVAMAASSVTLYILEKISIEEFSCIFKSLVELSNCRDHINLALNLFINESISKADVHDFSNGNDNVLSRIANVSLNMNLIELPYRHDLFLKEYLTKRCKNCKTVPRSGAVCLMCGTVVCVGLQCCRSVDHREGECTMHRKACVGTVGIFFLIRSCALLIISNGVGAIVPAPYVNAFGEHDLDLTSSSALFLNSQLYHGKLTEMWKNQELRDFILRNMDNSRMSANSWRML